MTQELKADSPTAVALPLESFTSITSNIGHIAARASLFGIPVVTTKPRILEIGCGFASNILSFLAQNPDAEVVAIDIDAGVVEAAKKRAESMGIKNVDFRVASIMDIDGSYGKFDYIIAHNVYSKLTNDVRDKFIEVCATNSNPHCVCYANYLAKPAWTSIKSVADLMKYHASFFATKEEGVAQAVLSVKFVIDAIQSSGAAGEISYYGKMLMNELSIIQNMKVKDLEDTYLSYNRAYYLHQFIREIKKHNMDYLCDSSLYGVYLNNFPQAIVDILQPIGDRVRVEQYLDFIRNTRVKSSIFVPQGNNISLTISTTNLSNSKLFARFSIAEEFSEDKVSNPDLQMKFLGYNGVSISTASPTLKCLMYVMYEAHRKPLTLNELLELCAIKCPSLEFANKLDVVGLDMMNLIFSEVVDIVMFNYDSCNTVSEKPKCFDLAIIQAKENDLWVSNVLNEGISLDKFSSILITSADGTRTVDDLVDVVCSSISSGELVVNIGDQAVSAQEVGSKYRNSVKELVVNALDRFYRVGLMQS